MTSNMEIAFATIIYNSYPVDSNPTLERMMIKIPSKQNIHNNIGKYWILATATNILFQWDDNKPVTFEQISQ